ncbi:hypothetical protein ACJIZ3_016339 [Penstemon smallii]|uniref:Uncharacterized protein n=1 Tax=Penstemon smallii TaxID=265156 RepID=A0ABD3RT79_9LAMI
MNVNEQIEEQHYVHMDSEYPYPVSEGLMGFFGGVSVSASPPPLHYVHMGQMHDQESAYLSMHMHSYECGPSGSESSSYYGYYDNNNNHAPRMDFNRRAWEYSSMTTTEEPIVIDIPSEQNTVSVVHSIPEEHHQDAVNSEVIWQDDIDPDNMTYEELLDLGEAVGTESRGLSQELINVLPTSKYKSGGIFSRRKSGDRLHSADYVLIFLKSSPSASCSYSNKSSISWQ